jgi:putative hemolysin
MLTDLVLTGIALLVLILLSTVESAYESLSEVSLRVMVSEREHSSRARFFRELLEHRRRFELMLVLGTQLSIAVIAILLANLFVTAGFRVPVLLALASVLAAILLFRQLIPRMIVQNNPEAVLWATLPIFRLFYRTFSIFVVPITALLDRARKEEPEEAQTEEEEELSSEDEIQAFIDVAEEEGIIEEGEGELIQSILEFGDTLVGEVMRPRTQIVAISAHSTIADARKLMIESKYSRIPVYTEQIDDIIGIVYVRDLLAFCEGDKINQPVTDCLRPAYFVPESKPIAELLEELQKAKIQLAMVIDEYGGLAGLVTVEDIIEEVLGEIEDEDRAAPVSEIVKEQDGSYLVDGSAEIRKVELLYNKEVQADDFTTVAGLLISELGHLPRVGERLSLKGLEFEVVDADNKRVNRVRLRELPPEEAAGAESTAGGE